MGKKSLFFFAPYKMWMELSRETTYDHNDEICSVTRARLYHQEADMWIDNRLFGESLENCAGWLSAMGWQKWTSQIPNFLEDEDDN